MEHDLLDPDDIPHGARERRDSTLTSISLLHLDPSPMDPLELQSSMGSDRYDSVYSLATDGSMEEGSTRSLKSGSTMAPGLSGSGRGAIYYLTRIQKYSSYAMSIFTGLHMANVSLIPAVTRTVAGSETYLLMTRELYQTPITEPLLVALPVMAHIGSGIALRLLRRSENIRRYGGSTPGMYALVRSRADSTGSSRSSVRIWPHLSRTSLFGYAFTAFYGVHVFMNRILPLVVEGDSSNIGLAYISHGFAKHPIVAQLAYGGLIVVGSGHMIWGMARWLGIAPPSRGLLGSSQNVIIDKKVKRQRRRRWIGIQTVVVATTALWAVGGLRVVAQAGPADGWVGKLYDDLFAKVGL